MQEEIKNAPKQTAQEAINGLPAELQKQLGEVKSQSLNEFITPNQK